MEIMVELVGCILDFFFGDQLWNIFIIIYEEEAHVELGKYKQIFFYLFVACYCAFFFAGELCCVKHLEKGAVF